MLCRCGGEGADAERRAAQPAPNVAECGASACGLRRRRRRQKLLVLEGARHRRHAPERGTQAGELLLHTRSGPATGTCSEDDDGNDASTRLQLLTRLGGSGRCSSRGGSASGRRRWRGQVGGDRAGDGSPGGCARAWGRLRECGGRGVCVRVNVSGCVWDLWVAFVCCCFACDCVLELVVSLCVGSGSRVCPVRG